MPGGRSMNALLRFAPWLTFTGSVATLLGLAWDARLHRLLPTLAAPGGGFPFFNPRPPPFPSVHLGHRSRGHDVPSGHGGMAAPAATPEQRAAAAKLLAEVRAGVAPYADFSTARTAGYRQVTPLRAPTWGPAALH